MYLEYWGLQRPPFSNVPTKALFYRSPQHDEAFSRLLYAVEHQHGVAMLTGEVGCGKTTVTKALMKHLNKEKYQFQMLSNPAMGPVDIVKAILLNFGKTGVNAAKPVLLSQLQEQLVRGVDRGVRTVLAIDEAHVINNQKTLDELRMLLNLQYKEQFLITLILLGQPPLLKRIAELQPLRERISVKYNLEPLDDTNMMHYILYRLKKVGATRGLFTSETIGPLYEYSKGIPLRINNACDRCLLIGFMRNTRAIDSRIVKDAIEDIQL